jgi:excisionase family DNA binding protein
MSSPSGRRTQVARFLSVAEAAAILKVSEVTIYRGISDGEFPAVKIRGRYVIPVKALDELEEAALRALPGLDTADDLQAGGLR